MLKQWWKAKRNIAKKKSQVRNVQALHKQKAIGAHRLSMGERHMAKQAMARTGDTGAAYTSNSPQVKKYGSFR